MSYFSVYTCTVEYVEKYKSGVYLQNKEKMHKSYVMLKTANNLRLFLQILILAQFAPMLIGLLSICSEGSFFAYV
jgi:hypothetical protein